MKELTGKQNSRMSWEKQSVWNLNNGFRVTVEFGYYHDFVTRIDAPTIEKRKMIWHCSLHENDDLPDWAKSWVETVNEHANIQIVRPGFKKEVRE
tara:strand:- start:183 stop:467 length:285 start_codon:yes stop_codon:yes gene_type:complete